jgi:hypothetical protein
MFAPVGVGKPVIEIDFAHDGLKGPVGQLAQIGTPAQSLYILKVALYTPGVVVHWYEMSEPTTWEALTSPVWRKVNINIKKVTSITLLLS